MKPQEFIETDLIQKSFGPRDKIAKQLSALRREDPYDKQTNPKAFPAGKKGNCPDIHALAAVRAIALLVYDPNPANKQECREVVERIKVMDSFLDDLALILENDGLSLEGHKVKAVFMCDSKPFAKIEFEGGGIKTYGDKNAVSGIEVFTILSTEVLQRFANLMKMTPKNANN